MKRCILYLVILCVSGLLPLSAEGELSIGPADLRAEQSLDGGYLLYVRKKPGMSSILLTESTRDPAYKADSFTWRAQAWHKENGDERRILDGEFLDGKQLWSLVDSTPVKDPQLGEAFRIFIPWVVVFGYPWSRYGEIQVLDGTYMNIRTFAKPYADYSGAYQDNPFLLRLSQAPLVGPPEGNYMSQTVKAFTELAKNTKATVRYSKGEADLPGHIRDILKQATGESLDLVICVDATQSMDNDIPFLKRELVPLLQEVLKPFKSWRIGVVQYRDYLEEFLYKSSPFTSDLAQVQKNIDRLRAMGGRDIPEAVNEALYAALKEYDWQAPTRLIILVGDAPPHPIPRGSVTEAGVTAKAAELQVRIETIILPQ